MEEGTIVVHFISLVSSGNPGDRKQNYIDSSTEISYTTGTDLFVGRIFTFEDILTAPSLALYEESGEVQFGRVTKQNRTLRFVIRDRTVQTILERAYAIYNFMCEHRVIEGTIFNTRLYYVFRTPAIIDLTNANIYMADFVLGYIVTAN